VARLPYADLHAAKVQPLVQRISAERGGVGHLYQMLLHSPPIAEGWLTYLTAVRQRSTLPGALRELVIMRVAILNRAPYEANQHEPVALREGVTRTQLEALADWQHATCYTPMQRAALELTDRMTRDVQVPAQVLDAVRQHFDEPRTVELVATVAAYNMVSRFLEALEIHADDARGAGGAASPPL
jgi:AhpD family alkylhydroperoxidase